MTSQASSINRPAVVPLSESNPIDFSLRNADDQAVLYIDNLNDTLHVDFTNVSSTKKIKLGMLRLNPNAASSHFILQFRPGTLDPATKVGLRADCQSKWKIGQEVATDKEGQGIARVFLICTGEPVLEPGQKITVTLENLVPLPAGGSRNTTVALSYQNLLAMDTRQAVKGERTARLTILNHQGKKQIPLYAGFVGSNKILNDGRTSNKLVLRLTNMMKFDSSHADRSAIKFTAGGDAPSTLIFTFIAGDTDTYWALGEDSQIKAIMVEGFGSIENIIQKSNPASPQPSAPGVPGVPKTGSQVGPKVPSFSGEKQIAWNIRAEKTGEMFALVLTPQQSTQLSAGEYIEFEFDNIVTAHPHGYTNLSILYEDIPGYWEGELTVPIEKAPVIYADNGVGIGTTDPQAALDVNGEVKAQCFTGKGAIPDGTVLLWYGDVKAVPEGWKLCDGRDGTPSLVWKGPEKLFYIMNTKR